MGNSRVSRLQYDDRDLCHALVHVDIHPTSESDSTHSFHPQVDVPQPHSADMTETGSPAEENGPSINNSSESADPVADLPSGLRKRNVFSTDSTTDSSDHGDENLLVDDMKKLTVITDKLTKDNCAHKSTTTQDPLHWFGILIPMALRQSQAAFRRTIDIICKLASLQTQLLDIRNEYRTVLKVKLCFSASSTVVEDNSLSADI